MKLERVQTHGHEPARSRGRRQAEYGIKLWSFNVLDLRDTAIMLIEITTSSGVRSSRVVIRMGTEKCKHNRSKDGREKVGGHIAMTTV